MLLSVCFWPFSTFGKRQIRIGCYRQWVLLGDVPWEIMVPSCEHAIVAIIGYTTTARSVVFHNVFHQKNLTQFIIQNQIDALSVQITPALAT